MRESSPTRLERTVGRYHQYGTTQVSLPSQQAHKMAYINILLGRSYFVYTKTDTGCIRSALRSFRRNSENKINEGNSVIMANETGGVSTCVYKGHSAPCYVPNYGRMSHRTICTRYRVADSLDSLLGPFPAGPNGSH